MNYDETGAAVKVCERCGKIIRIENWFAAIRTKYCTDCRKAVKRMQTANCMYVFLLRLWVSDQRL